MTTTLTAVAKPSGVAAHTCSSRSGYFPALDGIRAFAFLIVFADHTLQLPWGWAGVDVFFVLSGFLITGILYDTRNQPNKVRNFYIRRTLRIFPLYYGIILIVVLTSPVFHWWWDWRWLLWPLYLGNFVWGIGPHSATQPLQILAEAKLHSLSFPRLVLVFGHFWSLCVEEQFYLIWPWVVFWIKDRRKLLYICAAFLVICPVLRQISPLLHRWIVFDSEMLYRYTPFRVDALLIGGGIALLWRGPRARLLLPAARVTFAVLAVAAFLWIVLTPAAHSMPEGYKYPQWAFTWGLSFIDVVAASVLIMALESGSVMFRVFNLRPLRWLGRISYGAYVFHDIFHLQLDQFALRFTHHWRLGMTAMAFPLTLLLAWASFRWFELPLIRLKNRWTYTYDPPSGVAS